MIAIVLALAAFAFSTPSHAETTTSYSPKLSFRMTNGLLMNSGASGGTSMSLGGADLVFTYYLDPRFSIGLGYRADFDFAANNIPLSGYDLSGRWYFSGQGTYSRREYPSMTSERHDTRSYYVGMDIAHRNYFIGNVPTSGSESSASTFDQTTGSFLAINLAAGVDHRLSRHFELTAEGNIGLLTFAASDDQIRIAGYLINAGISYVW